MRNTYRLLDGLTLDICHKNEEESKQFLAIKNLYKNFQYTESFLPLITANALICYQLSSNGEHYWEEFSESLLKSNVDFNNFNNITHFFVDFLPISKGNKRLYPTKIKRLQKFETFFANMYQKQKFYYENMEILRNDLAKITNQSLESKTINFAVMIFGYGSRIHFGSIIPFPYSISIPYDSRLINIFKKLKKEGQEIGDFYQNISKKYDIPQLHLDCILWSNTQKLLEGKKLL